MRILIATDAFAPQVNGVVRTLTCLTAELEARGHEVRVVSPADFRTVPCPTYPEIRLALATTPRLVSLIRDFRPDAIHIATEGPVGVSARFAALRMKLPFTTSFHTRFPEYLRQRAPVPESFSYALLRRFHAPASTCLVPTTAVADDLRRRGFSNLSVWTRGVDRALFRPVEPILAELPRPLFMTVSRVAPEKNLSAFLDLDLPGSKVVVGGGPQLADLKARYPHVHFAGPQTGEALVRHYASADVFVFPSMTDTFGIVLIEALACGVPVAAYPEPGPLDVVGSSGAGFLSSDLREACLAALAIPRNRALARSVDFTWERCADIFLEALRPERARPSLALAG